MDTPVPTSLSVRMSRAEFRAWAERQSRGRFERVDGQVVPMTPERIVHIELKTAVWQALNEAVRAKGIEAQALGDGATVEIGEDTDYEPDALVNLGPRAAPHGTVAPNPVIVVEVLSPGTQSIDSHEKFAGYFSVPSISALSRGQCMAPAGDPPPTDRGCDRVLRHHRGDDRIRPPRDLDRAGRDLSGRCAVAGAVGRPVLQTATESLILRE